jgi:hypothetical protein
VRKIKKIKFTISVPLRGLEKGIDYEVIVKDDATFYEALSMVDKKVLQNPQSSIFPIYDGYIKSYLHLFWNPKKNELYDDIGIMPYGPKREFMPLWDDIDYNIIPNSNIDLQMDPGC